LKKKVISESIAIISDNVKDEYEEDEFEIDESARPKGGAGITQSRQTAMFGGKAAAQEESSGGYEEKEEYEDLLF
jgi:hypothetical protein